MRGTIVYKKRGESSRGNIGHYDMALVHKSVFFEDAIPKFGSFLVISTILVGEISQNFAENQP